MLAAGNDEHLVRADLGVAAGPDGHEQEDDDDDAERRRPATIAEPAGVQLAASRE